MRTSDADEIFIIFSILNMFPLLLSSGFWLDITFLRFLLAIYLNTIQDRLSISRNCNIPSRAIHLQHNDSTHQAFQLASLDQ